MNITTALIKASAIILGIWTLALAIVVIAAEVSEQYKLKSACELEVPRNIRCIVAYHPVEVVETWGDGTDIKQDTTNE